MLAAHLHRLGRQGHKHCSEPFRQVPSIRISSCKPHDCVSPVLSVLLSRRERQVGRLSDRFTVTHRQAGRLSDGFTVSHRSVQTGQNSDPEQAEPTGAGRPPPETPACGQPHPLHFASPSQAPLPARCPWRSLCSEDGLPSAPRRRHWPGSRPWGLEHSLGTSGGPSFWLIGDLRKVTTSLGLFSPR